MMNQESRGIKQLSQGKFLFYLNGKQIYYLTFTSIDMINIEIILIKLFPKETYVYKTVIPFQKIGTNDSSSFDALKNLNFIIYNFDFSLQDEFNKIILFLNTNSNAQIELFLYNKNMEKNNENMKKQLQMKKNLENMQNRMNELINTIQMQNKKIFELKQKEEGQIKLINKVDEVTKKIADEYNAKYKNNNNSINNNIQNNYYNNQNNSNQNNNYNNQNNIYNNQNNNYNNQNNNNYNQNNNNDMKKNLFISTRPDYNKNNYNPNDSNTINMNYTKNKKLNLTVNVELRPYLPDNTSMDNLLTRPQNMYPMPQQPHPFQPKKSINLDNIEDYRH